MMLWGVLTEKTGPEPYVVARFDTGEIVISPVPLVHSDTDSVTEPK